MKKINFLFVVVIMSLGIVYTSLGAFVRTANSDDDIGQERNICIQTCRGENNSGRVRFALSARCVRRCENTYWEKWNRQMNSANGPQVGR